MPARRRNECIFALMDNSTISSTFDDFDAYSIEMDAACVSQDYEVADALQKDYETTSSDDIDIQFE